MNPEPPAQRDRLCWPCSSLHSLGFECLISMFRGCWMCIYKVKMEKKSGWARLGSFSCEPLINICRTLYPAFIKMNWKVQNAALLLCPDNHPAWAECHIWVDTITVRSFFVQNCAAKCLIYISKTFAVLQVSTSGMYWALATASARSKRNWFMSWHRWKIKLIWRVSDWI